MARRLVKKREAKVDYFDVDSAVLIQIEADHPVWSDPEPKWVHPPGAIIKAHVPEGVTPERVDALVLLWKGRGVKAIKLISPTVSKHVAEDVEGQPEVDDRRTHREVVLDRAKRTKNVRSMPSLLKVLEDSLDCGPRATIKVEV